jgi:heme-degrading monooxygenase HmoA
MIQQKGCISKKLLRCRDANEFISYSEWNSEADIATYTIIFLVVFGLIWLMW